MSRIFRTVIVVGFFLWALHTDAQFEALPMSSASWATSFWVGPGYPHEGYYHSFDQNSPDTALAGQVFKKLRVRFSSAGYVYPGSSYGGALRDNGLGKVFYCEPGAAAPQLLYDFDVLQGDTVFALYSGGGTDAFVQSVDTIIVNAVPRKRIGLACIYQPDQAFEYWIQGIGGTGGFFYSSLCGSVSGIGALTCMSSNDSIQYGDVGGTGNCELSLGVPAHQVGASAAAVPNPSNDRFTLVVGGLRVERCLVFDAQGSWVKEELGPVVDLKGLKPGIYMAKAITSIGIFTTLLMLE